MKTLIIHPQDPTTAFLTGIYKDLRNKTVITGGIAIEDLRKHIQVHDHIIMCGHGTPNGLFSVGQFSDSSYIIDESMVEVLRNKTNIFIWCYADQFVKRHHLRGFATGMFVSEPAEASFLEYGDVDINLINESNYTFSSIVSKHLDESPDVMYENIVNEYGELARTNPIAKYNWERLYLNQQEPDLFDNKVA